MNGQLLNVVAYQEHAVQLWRHSQAARAHS